MGNKINGSLVLIIVVLGIAVGVMGVYIAFNRGTIAPVAPAPAAGTNTSVSDSVLAEPALNVNEPIPEPTANETESQAAWLTYNNPELGFAISYPTDFRLEEDNATSKLFSGPDGYFWILVKDDAENLDPAGIRDDYYKNDTYGYAYQDSFAKINGVDAYQQSRYDLGVIERYYFPKDGKIYTIAFEFNFSTPNQQLTDSMKTLIKKIITTFKLTGN